MIVAIFARPVQSHQNDSSSVYLRSKPLVFIRGSGYHFEAGVLIIGPVRHARRSPLHQAKLSGDGTASNSILRRHLYMAALLHMHVALVLPKELGVLM